MAFSFVPNIVTQIFSLSQKLLQKTQITGKAPTKLKEDLTHPVAIKSPYVQGLIAVTRHPQEQIYLADKLPELQGIALRLGSYKFAQKQFSAHGQRKIHTPPNWVQWGVLLIATALNSNVAAQLVPPYLWFIKPILVILSSGALVYTAEISIAGLKTLFVSHTEGLKIQNTLEDELQQSENSPVSHALAEGKLKVFHTVQAPDLDKSGKNNLTGFLAIGLLTAEFFASCFRMVSIGEELHIAVISMSVGTILTICCGIWKGDSRLAKHYRHLSSRYGTYFSSQSVEQLLVDVEAANDSTQYLLERDDVERQETRKQKQARKANSHVMGILYKFNAQDLHYAQQEQREIQPLEDKLTRLGQGVKRLGTKEEITKVRGILQQKRREYANQRLALVKKSLTDLYGVDCEYGCHNLDSYQRVQKYLLDHQGELETLLKSTPLDGDQTKHKAPQPSLEKHQIDHQGKGNTASDGMGIDNQAALQVTPEPFITPSSQPTEVDDFNQAQSNGSAFLEK